MSQCPTCHREKPCPTCGPEEALFDGAPRTERFHFFRRVIHGLHQLRLSFSSAKRMDLATRTSAVVYQVEEIEEAAKEVDDEPTKLQ